VAERKEVMQAWADYLDHLRESRKAIPLRTKRAEAQPARQGAKNRA